jgi:hypothetical protein
VSIAPLAHWLAALEFERREPRRTLHEYPPGNSWNEVSHDGSSTACRAGTARCDATADVSDQMRRLLATMLQLLVDAEATAFVDAEPHQRSQSRTNERNGTRHKLVATSTGDITVET